MEERRTRAVDWHKANVEQMLESLSCLRQILDLMQGELERLHSLDAAAMEDEELRANLTHIASRMSVLAHAFQIALH